MIYLVYIMILVVRVVRGSGDERGLHGIAFSQPDSLKPRLNPNTSTEAA